MFHCYHCGQCCEDIATQINLTLGDIKRISIITGKSAVELYNDKVISVMPFFDPLEPNKFEIDLGLFKPCRYLNKDKKCSIYSHRPLNCRLFPIWILAEAPKEAITEMSHDSGQCLKKLDNLNKKRFFYKNYVKKLSKVLDEENDSSDTFIKQLGLQNSIVIDEKLRNKEELKELIRQMIDNLQMFDHTFKFEQIDRKIQDWDDRIKELENVEFSLQPQPSSSV